MEDKKRSWDRHLSALREKGWAQSRQQTSQLEAVASKSAHDEDSSDDGSLHNLPPGPDALDFVFETIEQYVCGHEPTQTQEGGWDQKYADRGYIDGSKSEVCTLYKLGEVQKRSSVADRIKAFEANSALVSPPRANNVDGTPEPRSTSPVSRWTKPTNEQSQTSPSPWQKQQIKKSPGTPSSWQRPQMKKSPGSPNSWQRPQMERSPGTPNSWQKPQMERSPGSLPQWMHQMDNKSPETPQSEIPRQSTKVPVPPRNANSSHGTRSEKKQPIPSFPTKLKGKAKQPPRQDAIVARILKDSETESSGLSFVSYYEKEGIYVSKIRDTSKFKDTDLKRGMKVLRINGVSCPGRVKNVIKMLKSAKRVIEIEAISDDSIEFVAREKPSKKDKARSKSPSKRERSNHREIAGNSEDERGFTDMVMLSMGYVPQKPQEETPIERKDSSASIASLDRSEIPEKPKNKKVHAMVWKRSRRDKIGISFVSFKKKRGVYIYEMYEDSKFQRTGLEVGMKVLAINRQPCPERVSDTLSMVKDIEGQLIITAVAPSDEPTSTEAVGGAAPDSKPKVQTLNKVGKERVREYGRRSREAIHEVSEVSEGELLSRRERREILEDNSWMDEEYGVRQLTSSYSRDSRDTETTASTADQSDDNVSFWSSIFGG